MTNDSQQPPAPPVQTVVELRTHLARSLGANHRVEVTAVRNGAIQIRVGRYTKGRPVREQGVEETP